VGFVGRKRNAHRALTGQVEKPTFLQRSYEGAEGALNRGRQEEAVESLYVHTEGGKRVSPTAHYRVGIEKAEGDCNNVRLF